MAKQFDEMKRVVNSGAVKPPTDDLAFVFGHSDGKHETYFVIAKGDQVVSLTKAEIYRIAADFFQPQGDDDADDS